MTDDCLRLLWQKRDAWVKVRHQLGQKVRFSTHPEKYAWMYARAQAEVALLDATIALEETLWIALHQLPGSTSSNS